MKTNIVLGIDPGIANTGLAIVQGDTQYTLMDAQLIETSSCHPLGQRLDTIHEKVVRFLEKPDNDVDAIVIERCFHNKNISSSASTQQVLGLIHLIAHSMDLPILELTPQAVKKACGLGGRAKKEEMLRCAEAMIKQWFLFEKSENQHVVDACFAAIAGCLKMRVVSAFVSPDLS